MRIDAHNFDDLLLAYVYGELNAVEAAAFRAYVDAHPEAAAKLRETQQTLAALQPLADDFEPPRLAVQRVQVLAREAAERMEERGRSRLFFPRYAAALAATVAVVIGVTMFRVLPQATKAKTESEYDRLAKLEAPVAVEEAVGDEGARGQAMAYRSEFEPQKQVASGDGDVPTALAESNELAQRERGDNPAPATVRVPADVLGNREAELSPDMESQPATLAGTAAEPALNRLAYQAPLTLRTEAQAPSAVAEAEEAASQRRVATVAEGDTADDAGSVGRFKDERTEVAAKPHVVAPKLREEFSAGREQQRQGAYATAVTHFQNVVALAPDEPIAAEAQFETARTLQAMNDCSRAVILYQDVLDNAPAFPKRDDVLLQQAMCFERLGRYDEAATRYRLLAREFPDQQPAVQTRLDNAESQAAAQRR